MIPVLIAVGVVFMSPSSIRHPVVAGYFYPSNPQKLEAMVRDFLSVPKQPLGGRVAGLIAPHAGYVYSGPVAGVAYSQVKDEHYDTVIVLAPSHAVAFHGISIDNVSLYETPLGTIKVSKKAGRLRDSLDFADSIPEAHAREHSLEVHLPFLQVALEGDWELVPIIIGELSPQEKDELAMALSEVIDENTLVVASTDMTHYEPDNIARALDNETLEAIASLDHEFVDSHPMRLCGHAPVSVLLRLARTEGWEPVVLGYATSGDTSGDRSSVVGYGAVAFVQPGATSNEAGEAATNQELSPGEGQKLVEIARRAIEDKILNNRIYEPSPEELSPKLKEKRGAFVTLTKNGELRGCIGHIYPVEPLYLAVRDNAIAAALEDPRFPPVSPEELDDIDIEVSVLTVPEPVPGETQQEKYENIRPGIDGIVLERGWKKATFLPQVWEQLPDKDEFLAHLCLKAGMEPDCWKDPKTRILRYTVQAFHEEN